MRLYISIYLIVLFLFVPLSVNATNHYVDKNASGGNNGTSWVNAWQSFAAINWSSIEPGDIIYVSGGTDSTVYNEHLLIQASGTAANRITVRNSYDAGHNGRVIIDGSDYTGNGIQIGTSESVNPDYIYVKGFEVRRFAIGVQLLYAVEVVTLDSLIITDNNGRGMRIAGNSSTEDGYCVDSVIVQNCTISTSVNLPVQTDCLYVQHAAHITLYNNFFHQRNLSPVNNHSDALQSHYTRGWRIYDNVFIVDSNAQGMAIILGAQDDDGDGITDSVIIYNNYFYMGGIWRDGAPWVAAGNTGWNNYYTESMPPAIIVHNTFVSNGPYVAGFHIEFPATMINNIIAQFGDGVGFGDYWLSVFRTSPITPVDSVRENLLWTEWDDDMKVQGTITGNGSTGGCYSFSTWVNTYGGTGVSANPLFVDDIGNIGDQSTLDGELQSSSPAINQGEDVQALIESMGFEWKDINGNPRDRHPEIGAYEYVGRGDIIPPEVTGATLLDSITLKIMFSEALDETTAEDENNYSISGNIDIFNASLSGSEVTLQTSTHSPGSYIVTIVNVEDLAGNPIAQSNTAEYSLIPPDSVIMFTVEDVEGVIQEPGHTPLKTIDGLGALHGDPDSRWAARPMPEELIFDLGTEKTVCKTRLSFYRWNLEEVFTYSILTSSNHSDWVTIVSQASSAYQEEWTVDEFPAVDARYVKVLFINNNQSDWAGLWEGEIWGIIPTIADPVNNGLPDEFSLYQNYPNPFNPSTTISYSIPASSFVTLKVYDVLGNEIATLVNAEKPEGSYEVKFSAIGGSLPAGRHGVSGGDAYNLPSGVYIYRLQAGSFIETRKMILLR